MPKLDPSLPVGVLIAGHAAGTDRPALVLGVRILAPPKESPTLSGPSDHPDVDDAGTLTYLMHSVDAETGRANRVGRDGVMTGPDGSGVRHG